MAKIALSAIAGVMLLANALVAFVLIRMAGSSSEQLANVGGRLMGTLVLATVMALLSYKVFSAGELRFLKALIWGLVVWAGANSAQLKRASAGQQARLGEVFVAGCRKRCIEKTKESPEVTAQQLATYCEDYCDCLKEPSLAAMDRIATGPDARKRLKAEFPAALAADADRCDQRANAKSGLTTPAPAP